MQYAAVRVYSSEAGYKAVATVERLVDGKLVVKTEFSSEQKTPAEALAEALQITGFMDDSEAT